MTTNRRALLFRILALICACSLSIGSHFGQNTLGPLKSRLSREKGTSNTEFGLLIAAFSLNSTWTPLVGGILAARLGTTLTSIIATSLILIGQIILLLGDLASSIRTMMLGQFIFGLGISPLAVVQETIIVRFFNTQGGSLGLSLAIGLVAGKAASFVSARVSFPLSEWHSYAPFVASTLLAAFSFLMNVVYLLASRLIVKETGVELEDVELEREREREREEAQNKRIGGAEDPMSEEEALEHVVKKKKVNLGDLALLGDIFWLYIGINLLAGCVWASFPHLAPNIIEQRFNLTEGRAAEQASLLLAGSMFLYPICGYLTDHLKRQGHDGSSIVSLLLIVASLLTLTCYSWLALPPSWTGSALPSMISFGFGIGFSPLLLVIIVPHLVPLKYVSTALGAHKSIESSGSTLTQTLAGIVLDSHTHNDKGIQNVLNTLVLINLLQCGGIYWMRRKDRSARLGSGEGGGNGEGAGVSRGEYRPINTNPDFYDGVVGTTTTTSSPTTPLLEHEVNANGGTTNPWAEGVIPVTNWNNPDPNGINISSDADGDGGLDPDSSTLLNSADEGTKWRGRMFSYLSAGVIGLTWALFLISVFVLETRGKEKKEVQEGRVLG